MRKTILIGLFFLISSLLLPASSSAQTTTVTGTIAGPDGIPWAGGAIKAQLTSPGATVTITNQQQCASGGFGNQPCQVPIMGTVGPVKLDNSGSFTMNLYDVTQISPAGNQWVFSVTISPGIPIPEGFGPQQLTYTSTGTVISGASVSISTQLSAVAPALGRAVSAAGTTTFTGVNTFACGPQAGPGANPGVLWANCATGADICAQWNTAEGNLPANGGLIYVLPGSYNCANTIAVNKTVYSMGSPAGFEQNAGQHAPVRINWTSGTGPVVLCNSTSGIGSRFDGFEFNNSSATLVGFIDTENGCSSTSWDHIYIDRPTTRALNWGVKFGDPVTGPVEDTTLNNSQIAHAAPTGIWLANLSANAYMTNTWSGQNGYLGTVNTSNGALGACAANCIQLNTGANYPTDASWVGLPVIIGTTKYVISAMNSATSGTLTVAPGNQAALAFAFSSQATFGAQGLTSSNILATNNCYWRPIAPSDFPAEALEDALPVVNYVNIVGAHTHTGDTFEVGSNSGITGYAEETAANGSIQGGISCIGCTLNATVGPAAGVTAYIHANTATASIQLVAPTFEQNAGVAANPIVIFQNDSSASIFVTGAVAKLAVTINYANGTLNTTNGVFLANINGSTDMGNLIGTRLSTGQFNVNNVTAGDINIARGSGNLGKIWFGNSTSAFDFGASSAGTFTFTVGRVRLPTALQATGVVPTVTGTGACATNSTQTGGEWAGTFTCTGTTGAATITITPGSTTTTGWNCNNTKDQTTVADTINQTSTNTTSATLTAAAIANGDVIVFSCFAY